MACGFSGRVRRVLCPIISVCVKDCPSVFLLVAKVLLWIKIKTPFEIGLCEYQY